MSIDRNSPVPIYHQLKMLIQERIQQGVWRPGDRIPTQDELCSLYQISRAPVRQALSELAHEGVLMQRPGVGTFVCQKSPSSAVTIQMMASDAMFQSHILDHVVRVWNATNPTCRLSLQVETVSHGQLYNQLGAAVGSGAAPDVAMVDCVWVAGLAQAGFLYALEEMNSRWNQDEFVQNLYPAFVAANSFNGLLYGVPVKADVSLLWYRRDWFDAEGLEPPQDWDALVEVGRYFLQPAVRQRYGMPYPFVFPGGSAAGEATVYNLMPLVWSAGAAIFDGETVVLDAAGTRRALQFLRDVVNLHRISPIEIVDFREDTAVRLFAAGKAAMALGGSYESDIILEASGWNREEFHQRVGFVPSPAAPGGKTISTVGGTSYVILRQSQHPALTMDLLRVATDPAIVGELFRTMWYNSPNPSFNETLSPDSEPLLAWTGRMLASGRARPSIPEYVKVSRQLQAMFEAAIAETVPIDQIARRAAEFIGVISERPCRHEVS